MTQLPDTVWNIVKSFLLVPIVEYKQQQIKKIETFIKSKLYNKKKSDMIINMYINTYTQRHSFFFRAFSFKLVYYKTWNNLQYVYLKENVYRVHLEIKLS
jgi:hypothetical protein